MIAAAEREGFWKLTSRLFLFNEASRALDRVEELETRYRVEEERLKVMVGAADSQLALQNAQVGRLNAVAEFQRGRVRSMKVLAGAHGILQELPLEVGQWAQSGATLARLVEPGKLKAVLRIPETQAKDIAIAEMRQQAAEMGANAVVGVDLDYENITVGQTGGMLMVSASGTAVVV